MTITTVIKNTTIVVTRPATRSDKLIAQLTDLGYNVLNIPCIEIQGINPVSILTNPKDPGSKHFVLDRDDSGTRRREITHYSIIIFVSINAVISFFQIFNNIQFQNNTKFLTIGSATATELKKYTKSNNVLNISYPKSDTQEASEYFVKLPELAEISKDDLLLVRGDASREYIKANLAQRAGSFTELITYKTVITEGVIISEQLINNNNYNLIILFTSISCLEGFYNKLDNYDLLLKNKVKQAKILVVSQRIANRAKKLGFTKIYCTFSMHDRAIIGMINKIN